MYKTIKDLNRSIAATGGQSQFTAGQVKEFAKSMRMTKEEALEALQAFEQFGAAARISLSKVFGDEATFNMLAMLNPISYIYFECDLQIALPFPICLAIKYILFLDSF